MSTVSEATQILVALNRGDRSRVSRLMELVYHELRGLAAAYTRGHGTPLVLQPTELVHEAFLRLIKHEEKDWRGRSHFFAVAATAMRQILVDEARKRHREKRGGDHTHVVLDDAITVSLHEDEDVLAVDEALGRLSEVNPYWARLVELRFFGGMTVEEISIATGVPKRTAERDWSVVRAWLRRELS